MGESTDTEANQTDDTSDRIVNRRGVLTLLGVPSVLGSVAYLRQLGGRDDRSVPNGLEYALPSRVEWVVETGGSSPTVADGTVYVMDSQTIHAFATEDGTERWAVDPTGDEYASYLIDPIVADGVVYAFPREKPLYALDATDGSERWTADLGDVAAGQPTVAGDTVYFGCDETMYALDPADGSTRWSVEIAGFVGGSPVVDDDTVYFAGDETVYGLDTADGTERWTTAVDGSRLRVSAQAGDTLYARGWDGIYALDGADGTERWRVDFPTSLIFPGGLAVADDTVYASVRGGPLYEIDSDGNAWPYFQVENGMATSPVVADRTVYVGSNVGDSGGRLHALDTAEGTERWSFPVGLSSAPAVADGTVYASGDSLYALET